MVVDSEAADAAAGIAEFMSDSGTGVPPQEGEGQPSTKTQPKAEPSAHGEGNPRPRESGRGNLPIKFPRDTISSLTRRVQRFLARQVLRSSPFGSAGAPSARRLFAESSTSLAECKKLIDFTCKVAWSNRGKRYEGKVNRHSRAVASTLKRLTQGPICRSRPSRIGLAATSLIGFA